MTTAVLYATACRSEFLSDPRVIIREIESLQAFASRMGWDLVSGSNMDLPGVYYDPATSDKIQRPITRDGFREAFALSADTIVVQNLGRIAPSLATLAEVLDDLGTAGKRLAVVEDELVLDSDWSKRIREILPLHRQTHGGRLRAARGAKQLPGRPAKSPGRLPAYEMTQEIDGASVRVPNVKVLRELARADQMRSEGLSWGDVADKLEEELAKAEGRPPLDDDPISVDRYIRKCSRALHSADWNFRQFIEEHSFNRPEGKISRRWGRVRLIRILHTQRPQLEAWLRRREMVLAAFLDDSEGAGHEEGTSDVRDVVGNST